MIKHLQENNGPEDQLAYCHSALASCYRELGDIDNAIQYCEQALNLRVKLYGNEHELTKSVSDKLNKLQLKQSYKQKC